jgi:serine/threonine protein kinase
MPDSADKHPKLLKQRYHIVAHLGKGGMGTVYKALDTQLGNRLVAVKEMIQENLDPQRLVEATTTFKHEAHLLAHLHHAHLPSIYEFFEEHNRWYIVMSFIEGETLEHYLSTNRKGYLAVAEVLNIGIQVCTALEYLHAQQPPIIFRDLKPSNIMRTPGGQLYLIDFGIARHFKAGQMKDTIAFGSYGYAAPEQYGQAQTSPRSDIYSLGVILHQLLTGEDPSKKPFYFTSLSRQNCKFPIELDNLLQKMLDMQSANRPENIQIVKQQLSTIAQGYTEIQFLSPTLTLPKLARIPALSPQRGTLLHTFSGHSDYVTAVAWSPNSDQIASGSRDKTIQIWDVNAGSKLLTYSKHTQAVACLNWSPNGTSIASGDFERIIRIWNASTGEDLLIYHGHNVLWAGGDAVRALAWSPDGTRIASVSGDNVVQLWHTVANELILTYQGHNDAFPVRCVAWSPDGTLIASAAQYCDIWNAVTGEKIYSDRSGQTHALAWSADSTYLAISISDLSSHQEPNIKLIRVADGQQYQSYQAHTRPAYALAWSHDGTAIASASNDIHVWNPYIGKPVYIYQGHQGHVSSLAWSLDDTRIASGGIDTTVQIWQIGMQKPIPQHNSIWTP